MRRGICVAIRQRRDGSVYFHKRHPTWSAISQTFAIVLLILFLALLLILEIVHPSTAQAQEPNCPAVESLITAKGIEELNGKAAPVRENVADLIATALPRIDTDFMPRAGKPNCTKYAGAVSIGFSPNGKYDLCMAREPVGRNEK